MTRSVQLLTPLSVFESLHKSAETRKALATVVPDDLAKLLVDHSALVAACKAAGIQVVEPRERPRLTKA